MALEHCILGKFLGVGCHCFPPPLDVPTFAARCLHGPRSGRWKSSWAKNIPRIRLPHNSRDLLHVANLRHGTDGFTSPPKEGMLRILSPLKNPTASAGTLTPRPPKPFLALYFNKNRRNEIVIKVVHNELTSLFDHIP
jgi:hypothetical protein